MILSLRVCHWNEHCLFIFIQAFVFALLRTFSRFDLRTVGTFLFLQMFDFFFCAVWSLSHNSSMLMELWTPHSSGPRIPPLQACPVLTFFFFCCISWYFEAFFLTSVCLHASIFLLCINEFYFTFEILLIYLISPLQISLPHLLNPLLLRIQSAKPLDLFPIFSVFLHSASCSSITSCFSFITHDLHLYLGTKHIHIKTLPGWSLGLFLPENTCVPLVYFSRLTFLILDLIIY